MKLALAIVSIVGCALVASLPAKVPRVSAEPGGAPSRLKAAQLQLPVSSFSPASVDSSFVLKNANADLHSTGFWPRSSHSADYDTWNRSTGYFQDALWQPSDANSKVNFDYSGSIFTAAAGAHSAWQDGASYLLKFSNVTANPCPAGIDSSCTRVTDAKTTDGYYFYFDVIQINRCLIETRATALIAAFQSQVSQITQTLNAIDVAAVGIARSVCTSSGTVPTPVTTNIRFTVISARVENLGAKPDWGQVRPPLKQLKKGAKAQLAMYFDVQSAPAKQPYTIHWKVLDGNRIVLNRIYSRSLNATPVSTWRDWVPLTPARRGNYTATGTITMGSVIGLGQVTFTVVRIRPPAAPPVSFSFDSLYTADRSGKRTSTFKAGDAVGVIYIFTVRNLSGTTPLTVIRSYRKYMAKLGWVLIGHPVPEIGDTSNGPHTVKVYSVPNPTVDQQQILVGITIGSTHREKAVTFTIHK